MWNKAIMAAGVLVSTVGWASARELTICLPLRNPYVGSEIVIPAEGYATRIYRSIGIKLQWKSACTEAERDAPCTRPAPNLGTIAIQWMQKAPAGVPAGAWASAFPFRLTGTRIVLYHDRLALLLRDKHLAPAVLGHVLAHEIGHILLGTDSHAEKGLMKAYWNSLDQSAMTGYLMQFTPAHVEAIHQNLDRRTVLMSAR